MCLRGVSTDEVPVLQVVLPPLLWSQGRKVASGGGGLEREWMGGYHIVRREDLTLLKP